jgi:hypothetical protein
MELLLPLAIALFKEARGLIVLICGTESAAFAPDTETRWGSSSMTAILAKESHVVALTYPAWILGCAQSRFFIVFTDHLIPFH